MLPKSLQILETQLQVLVRKPCSISISYATNGIYTLRFRLPCAADAVLLSQARFEVNQPPAARCNADNRLGTNAVTRPTSALFTDTRAYSSPNGFYAATGRVTVALSDNNHTGTILRPLIVIEGYDASTVQTMKKRYAHRLGPAKTKPGIVPNA